MRCYPAISIPVFDGIIQLQFWASSQTHRCQTFNTIPTIHSKQAKNRRRPWAAVLELSACADFRDSFFVLKVRDDAPGKVLYVYDTAPRQSTGVFLKVLTWQSLPLQRTASSQSVSLRTRKHQYYSNNNNQLLFYNNIYLLLHLIIIINIINKTYFYYVVLLSPPHSPLISIPGCKHFLFFHSPSFKILSFVHKV